MDWSQISKNCKDCSLHLGKIYPCGKHYYFYKSINPWIEVTKKIPPHQKLSRSARILGVNVESVHKEMIDCYYDDRTKCYLSTLGNKQIRITHWSPLPPFPSIGNI